MREKFDYVDFIDNLFTKALPNNPRTAGFLTWLSLVVPPLLVCAGLLYGAYCLAALISGSFVLKSITTLIILVGGFVFGSTILNAILGPTRRM